MSAKKQSKKPKRPTFLFAFANDADGKLRLGVEMNACWNELADLHDNMTINYNGLGFATLDQIYTEFNRYNDHIYLFHYGGHSDSEFLLLHGAAGIARHYSTPLGQQNNLKLVFLNGCKNYNQVEALFDVGVPVVIATRAPIDDRRAIFLARQFYQALAGGSSILQAFERAKSLLIQKHPELESTYRQARFQKKDRQAFSWGIFHNGDGGAAALDWTIHHIAAESLQQTLDQLRRASRNRLDELTINGRFRHLDIKEAILAGIPHADKSTGAPVHDNLSLDQHRQSLANSLTALWVRSTPHTMLAGPGGMGKTVSLLRLWKLWTEEEVESVPAPIYIQLQEFNNEPAIDFLRKYVRKHYLEIDLDQLLKTPRQPTEGQRWPQVIFLLDGLNEVAAPNTGLLHEINQLMRTDNYPGLQLVLTARTDLRETYQWQDFHLLELQLLTDEQIRAYLGQQLPAEPRLLELLRNPMMLSLYAAQSELPEQYRRREQFIETPTSTGELLANVETIQRIKMMEQNNPNSVAQALRRFALEHLLPYLAWEMQRAGMFSIREEEKGNLPSLLAILGDIDQGLLHRDFFRVFKDLRGIDRSFFRGKEDWELVEPLIQQICCQELAVLVREDDQYRFLHQHFRDYFAARHVQNQIDLALYKEEIPSILRDAPLDFYVRQLLGELEGEHTNTIEYNEAQKTWRWREGSFFLNNRLSRMLEQCRGVFDRQQLGYTLWNLLVIWKEQRGELSGADLSRLDFRGCSLNGLRMSRPGLAANLSGGILSEESLLPPGHSGWVFSAVFDRKGERIASGSNDRAVKIWDARSGQYLRTLTGHAALVYSTDFSPDGKYLASGSQDRTVRIWETETGACRLILQEHVDEVRTVRYSLDGHRLASGAKDKTVKIWDASTGQCLHTLEGHEWGINSVVFSPDGRLLASASSDKTSKIWDAETGECRITLEGHSGWVTSVAFSPNGQRLVSSSKDKTIKIWDIQTGACLATLNGHAGEVTAVAFLQAPNRIVSSSADRTIRIWDAQSGQCLLTLQGHIGQVNSIAGSLDGKRLVSASSDNTVRIWDAHTGQSLLLLEGYLRGVESAAFRLDGERIVTGSADGTVKIWDARTGQCRSVLEGHAAEVYATAFSPNGLQLASASRDGAIRIWDAQTGKCISTLIGHTDRVNAIAFRPDGQRLLSGASDNTIRIWDTTSGACLSTLHGHSAWVWCVAFDNTGERVVSGSQDKTIRVWDVQSGQCIRILTGHSKSVNSVDLSPDGKTLISSSADHTIKIWELQTGQYRLTLQGHLQDVYDTTFSPDGDLIASGSRDTTVKIWDARSGKCLQTCEGHQDGVKSVRFSPDGRFILSASRDDTIKVWDAETGQCRQTLPNIAGLLIQGCDFRNLHTDTKLPADLASWIQQYGGIMEEGNHG